MSTRECAGTVNTMVCAGVNRNRRPNRTCHARYLRDPSRDRGNKSRKAEITGHPFTASEAVKQGPLVSEHQKKTEERHKGGRQKPDPDLGDGPGPGNVKHQDYSAPNPAQLSGDVYGACITTVLVSWISPSQNPKQNDREVD